MLQSTVLQRVGHDLAAEQRITTERDPGLPWWLSGKESACQHRHSFDPGVGKTPWRRKQQLLQYSSVENPMDRGARWAMVHGVAKGQARLSN